MSSTKAEKPPGLITRARRNGAQAFYWAARSDLVAAGYYPKLVRLHGDPDAIAARCHVLQGEMLTWSVEHAMGPKPAFVGTFASLVKFYESHPESPYHKLRPATQRTYSKTLASLIKHKGSRLISAVDGSGVGRWYDELVLARSRAWAYYTMNVLKAALSFGASKRITECRLLREELRTVRFTGGKKRKEYLTYKQVIAFRDAAHRMGFDWMALCLMLQFELGLRRRDVIGDWIKAGPGTDGVRHRTRIWRDGATWAHIDEAGVFRKLVSKTAFTSEEQAVHVIADYPALAAELARIPPERRIGPIVINPRTGLPPTEGQCRRHFRLIARQAGIPDEVWMMDARAGANTEAYEAGATEEEAMALLTHTETKTNRNYLREKMEQSRRAAAKRVESRKK